MSAVGAIFERPTENTIGDLEVDRLLTAPNLITAIRALCIPLVPYLLLIRDSRGWAGFAMGLIVSTDWIDGYVARRFNQGSTFGKMFDPTVDRVLMIVAIVAIIVDGAVPLWYSLTIVIREVVVSLWVVTITAMGAKRMNVTWWGKCGTFANMAAFPWFLFAHEQTFSSGVRTFWNIAAYTAAIPGVILSLAAAAQYVPLGLRALAEGRAERDGAATAPI